MHANHLSGYRTEGATIFAFGIGLRIVGIDVRATTRFPDHDDRCLLALLFICVWRWTLRLQTQNTRQTQARETAQAHANEPSSAGRSQPRAEGIGTLATNRRSIE